MRLSVVMPVYNEEPTLEKSVDRVLARPEMDGAAELVLVDDASTDGTPEVITRLTAADPRIKAFRHETNAGKGAALRTGFRKVTGDVVLIQDADLEYDPSDYPVLLGPILEGRADVVFGSRFAGAGAHRVLYFWHSVANRSLTTLSNMFTNLNLTDMEACFKVFRREVLDRIEVEEDRFGFEPEIVAKVAAMRPKLRIYEVPISYHGRTYEEGKKIGWRDGVSALRCILKYGMAGGH